MELWHAWWYPKLKRKIEENNGQVNEISSNNPPKRIKMEPVEQPTGNGAPLAFPGSQLNPSNRNAAPLAFPGSQLNQANGNGVPPAFPGFQLNQPNGNAAPPAFHGFQLNQANGNGVPPVFPGFQLNQFNGFPMDIAQRPIKIEEPEDVGAIQYLGTYPAQGSQGFMFPIEFKKEGDVAPLPLWVDQKPVDLEGLRREMERKQLLLEVVKSTNWNQKMEELGINALLWTPEEILKSDIILASFERFNGVIQEPNMALALILHIKFSAPPAIRRLEPQFPVLEIHDEEFNPLISAVIKNLFEKMDNRFFIPLIRIHQIAQYEKGRPVPSLSSCITGRIEIKDCSLDNNEFWGMVNFGIFAIGSPQSADRIAEALQFKAQFLKIADFDLEGGPLMPTGNVPAFFPFRVNPTLI